MLVITHVVMLSEHNTLRICLHSPLETNNTYKLVFSKNTLSKDFSSIYIGKKKVNYTICNALNTKPQ